MAVQIFALYSLGEIVDSSPAVSSLSAADALRRKGGRGSLEWKELAIVTKNSNAKQPQVRDACVALGCGN